MSDYTKAWIWLAEVLSTLTIIASAAVIGVPKYGDLRRRDTAAKLLADVDIMRTAVYAFYSDSAYFPPESPGESIPESLEAYLPRNFSFLRSYGTIAYRNWPVRVSMGDKGAANMIGATVTTRDPRIGATAAALVPAAATFTVGDKYTFVFFGT